MRFPAIFNVDTNLTGSNGFKLISNITNSDFGISVASAGDLNGDGIQDIVIGAHGVDAAYVIFGSNSIFHTSYAVEFLLNGTNGFKLTSTSSGFGQSVASAGDFNGDGIQDIVIGTAGNINDYPNTAYVVFGNYTFQTPYDVDSLLNGTNGFKLTSTSHQFGYSVASAGDFNGDGIKDITIGTYGASPYAAYAVFSTNRTFPCTGTSPCSFAVNSLLNGRNGFQLTSTSSYFGISVASAGDFNGDGIHDIVIGATNAAAAYVVLGTKDIFPCIGASPCSFDVGVLTGKNGFQLSGSAAFGYSVASAGDFNGDGVGDIVVGTNADIGFAYVIFGTKGAFPCTGGPPCSFDVDSLLTGNNGFKLTNCGGWSVASAGDFNRDGTHDIVIGNGRGSAYVVFGTNSAFPCTGGPPCSFDVDSFLTGSNGFKLTSTNSGFGRSVASVVDFNGDAIHDIAIGGSGVMYVVYGQNVTAPSPEHGPMLLPSPQPVPVLQSTPVHQPTPNCIVERSFPAIFDVTSLNGCNGFELTSANDAFGFSLASAGDLNVDGIQDIVIGADTANAAYVVFGINGMFPCTGTSPCSFVVDSLLAGRNGFKLTSTSSYFGGSVTSAGDFNGDGIQDIVIGTGCGASGACGSNTAYIIFGTYTFQTPFDADSLLTGRNGFQLISTSSNFGVSVASAGDLNGDQIQDIVIGTTNNANSAYVIFGSRSTFQTPFNVDSLLTGSNGFKLTSTSNNFGGSVASAGDLNGDGVQDIVIGTYYGGAGAAYVVFGSRSTFQTPFAVDSLLNGSNGFKLTSASGAFGFSVASAGDINRDGIQDIVIGAAFATAAYVVFGNHTFHTPFDVDSLLIGSNGFKLISTSSNFGESVASAGDLNGDGINDIVIGAYGAKTSYAIFGSKSTFQTPFDVDSILNGTNGFKLTSTSSNFGQAVASAGDFNGDGIQDVMIGTYEAYAVYIVYGRNCTVLSSSSSPMLLPSPQLSLIHTPEPNQEFRPLPEPVPMPAIPNPESYPIPEPNTLLPPFAEPPPQDSSSGSLVIALGVTAGTAVVGVAGGIAVYAKIKHLWCWKDSNHYHSFVEPMPEIPNDMML